MGKISPMQYGQFIEYLCTLVPSMWAEKLYDTSFDGLTPYKVAYIKETDFKEQPWYPYGETNRLSVQHDTPMEPGAGNSERIELSEGSPCEGGVAQDGISLKKGISCRFSTFVRGQSGDRLMSVKLFHGNREFASTDIPIGTGWRKVSADLVPNATDSEATLAVQFRGPGRLWLDCVSLMPSDNIGGWRNDVVSVLRDLKPSIIRVGGSVMDDPNLGAFEWSQTVGPVEKRIPFQSWGGLQPPGAGLEEVVQLIRSVGSEPLICVRYEKKTPADAAQEVEYFNGSVDTPMGSLRAKNGHPAPYHIKYWQVGNERWGKEYWQAVPRFCEAMRRTDPSIKLLSSFPSPDLIDEAGKDLDYVCPHQYNVEDLRATSNELDEVRKMILEHASGQPLKVGVTEWNTTAGDFGLGRAKLWTLKNALDCARYQNLLHRNADLVEIANRSNLSNSFCSGVIQTNRSTLYLTPTYYAQQLYSNYGGDIPLTIKFATPPVQPLDFSATISAGGEWLTFFAVNETASAEPLRVNLEAFGNPKDGERYVLADRTGALEPDATNSFEQPTRICPIKESIDTRRGLALPPLSLTVLRINLSPSSPSSNKP